MTKTEKEDVRYLIRALEEAVGLLTDSLAREAIVGAVYIEDGMDIAKRLRVTL